jgi:hypothetical protein
MRETESLLTIHTCLLSFGPPELQVLINRDKKVHNTPQVRPTCAYWNWGDDIYWLCYHIVIPLATLRAFASQSP